MRLKQVLFLSLILPLLAGCSKDKTEPGPPIPVQFDKSSLTVMEGGNDLQIKITFASVLKMDETIKMKFTGTAEYGVDYTLNLTPPIANELAVTIPAGSISFTFSMHAISDTQVEPDDSVVFSLADLSSGIIAGSQNSVSVRILDDSPIQFDQTTLDVVEGGPDLQIMMTLGVPVRVDQTVTVTFTGTADYGDDFTLNPAPDGSNNLSIVIPANSSSVLIMMHVVDDNKVELTETLNMSISNVPNDMVIGANGSVAIHIINNPVNSNLVAEYLFNGNANDTGGNGHDGQVHGATLTTDRSGNANSAYYFNGNNQYIVIPNHAEFNFGPANDFSVSLWVAVTDDQVDQSVSVNSIMRQWVGDSQGYPFEIGYYNLNNAVHKRSISVARYDGSACNHLPVGSSNAINPDFHHVVFLKSGNKLLIYVDNAFAGNFSDTTTCSTMNTSDLFIGCQGGTLTSSFTGKIDDIRIYNRALASDEIGALFLM